MADISSVKLPDASEYDVTDAEALHSSDPVNNLNSTSTSLPLAANMGHAIGNNLAAIEESGAKNLNSYPYYGNKVENGITWTVNSDGSVTVSGIATATAYIELHNRLPETPNTCILKAGTYILTGGVSSKVTINIDQRDSGGSYTPIGTDSGSGLTFTIVSDVEFPNAARIGLTLVVDSGTDLSTPVTIYPMVRDARVNDSTFMPYAKTNVQLTNDKAERKDLTTIFATGTTNNTGAQIAAGKYFYLNNQHCKALTDIAANASFTKNTNYTEKALDDDVTTVVKKTESLNLKIYNLESGVLTVNVPLGQWAVAIIAANFPSGANNVKNATYIVTRQGTSVLMNLIGGNDTITITPIDYSASTVTLPSNPYGATVAFLQLS